MKIKYKTKFTNLVGDKEYPIYLTVRDGKTFDLECDIEIYAMAWYLIYEKSIESYFKGELDEER